MSAKPETAAAKKTSASSKPPQAKAAHIYRLALRAGAKSVSRDAIEIARRIFEATTDRVVVATLAANKHRLGKAAAPDVVKTGPVSSKPRKAPFVSTADAKNGLADCGIAMYA